MRWLISTVVLVALAPSAFADDLDALRGSLLPVAPATFTRWSGFYFGGQVGVSDARADFSHATQSPIAFQLRETALENDIKPSAWPVLGTSTQDRANAGAFIGYNTQFQDLMIGVEANYNQASLSAVAPNNPIGRITPGDSGGNVYSVNITGSGSVTNLDYGSLRARGGWIIGNFMPYGFVGLALGMADTSVSTTISGVEYTSGTAGVCTAKKQCVPFSFSAASGRQSQVMYGIDAGAGLDVAVTANIFLRGEYEFVQFAPVSGITVDINSIRAGAGFKF